MSRFLCLLFLFTAPLSFGELNVYRLGPGDLISISVYDEPDLSLDLRIGLSGNVSYPLLGDIAVAGLSPKDLEQKLLQKLKGPYLIDPSVSVSIVEYRPFYVTGEVQRPGSYSFHPGLTIDKAISIAGGFTERASKSRIYVVHDLTSPKQGSSNIVKERVEFTDVVSPGDVVTVEQGFF